MVHVVIDKYFSLFLNGLKIFLNPRRSLIVPLNKLKFCSRNWRHLYWQFTVMDCDKCSTFYKDTNCVSLTDFHANLGPIYSVYEVWCRWKQEELWGCIWCRVSVHLSSKFKMNIANTWFNLVLFWCQTLYDTDCSTSCI